MDFFEEAEHSIARAEQHLELEIHPENTARALAFAQVATAKAILAYSRAKTAAPTVPAAPATGPSANVAGPKSEPNATEARGIPAYYVVTYGSTPENLQKYRFFDYATARRHFLEAIGMFSNLVTMSSHYADGTVKEVGHWDIRKS